ncbi:MAG: hypothetical protein ABI559_11360 [Chloroflexota bacterium]
MGQGEGGGPKTPEGKAVSSRNSQKHALRSTAPVIPWVESKRDWLEFRKSILESLGPEGAVESEFAEQAALLFWRLRRVTRYEHETLVGYQKELPTDLQLTAHLEHAGWPPEPEDRYSEMYYRWARGRVIPKEAHLDRIVRYESHLRRQLRSVLRELWFLQSARREGKGGRWVELRGE